MSKKCNISHQKFKVIIPLLKHVQTQKQNTGHNLIPPHEITLAAIENHFNSITFLTVNEYL